MIRLFKCSCLQIGYKLSLIFDMGKAEKNNDSGVPGLPPDMEASKVLEAALLQMDGIISG